eukprot:GILK01001447.1.p1 GENE.GILK01001447.1~~GILK01001447.1.p1  ORF type:complete len:784 (-),score=93.89 GILK01001447.1:230-2512(-)
MDKSSGLQPRMATVDSAAQKWAPILRYVVLGLICALAFSVRIFSVIRYESVIHEFDPYFNYRTTQYLAREGFYEFWNWFDESTWYPLGRVIGGTLYPGLMVTAGLLYWIANFFHITVNIRNVCVFLAPIFSANTALATYLFTTETTGRTQAGLMSALFMAIVPSYISRSVAGSYDNEGVAIFALVFTFYVFIKAVNTGTIFWATMSALAYFYMVASWGGYVFIINIIPIFVLFLLLVGRFSDRLYIAYSVFYTLGSLLAMQIPFVSFQVVTSSEHMASHGVFVVLQTYVFVNWIRGQVSRDSFRTLSKVAFLAAIGLVASVCFYLTITGKTRWSGRSLTLLDPTYAKKYIPIIASVSEHQPTTWSSFFFDLHVLVILAPVGLWHCFKSNTDAGIFAGLYGVLAVYFAGVMVRLMLVLAPAVCILSGIGVSATMTTFLSSFRRATQVSPVAAFRDETVDSDRRRKKEEPVVIAPEMSLLVVVLLTFLVGAYITHCTWAGAEAYSSPSIVMASRTHDGGRVIFDDYREAYYWLRQNTAPDAKIMSWWDYGYQITAMGNRTVLVDNNTWNNTHIATVGMAMSSPEHEAYQVMRRLDVDYVLVIFGGLTGYSSDDINKFLWMVRIGGGVYPWIKEEDYYSNGQYRIDSGASSKMLNCLMYKLSYYRFDEITTDYSRPAGFDRVRGAEMGKKNIKLDHLDEAFTSEHWIVRIYSVRKPRNKGDKPMKSRPFNKSQAREKRSRFARVKLQSLGRTIRKSRKSPARK